MVKDVSYYQKEVQENEIKLAQMKKEKRDPYDIKKFEEVLGESYMMIPDSQSRMEKALVDLATFLDKSSGLNEEGEFMVAAKQLLEKHVADTGKKGIDDIAETSVDQLKEGEAF